jgi:hypothetical protein
VPAFPVGEEKLEEDDQQNDDQEKRAYAYVHLNPLSPSAYPVHRGGKRRGAAGQALAGAVCDVSATCENSGCGSLAPGLRSF